MQQACVSSGPTKGLCLEKDEFENALSEYYKQSGWDEVTGNPTRETYSRLRLDWIADQLNI